MDTRPGQGLDRCQAPGRLRPKAGHSPLPNRRIPGRASPRRRLATCAQPQATPAQKSGHSDWPERSDRPELSE